MSKKIIVIALLLSLLLSAVGLAEPGAAELSEGEWIAAGFYPVSRVMQAAGYAQTGAYAYEAQVTDAVSIHIEFNPEAMTCQKNQYAFNMAPDQFRLSKGALYLTAGALRAILAREVSFENGDFALTQLSWAPGEWTRISRLIAHAGGAVKRAGYHAVSTNAFEALVENYDLGYRVFEFDFHLTSDGGLALVHDWKRHGTKDGNAMTSAGWKATTDSGRPATKGRFTTMLVEDLLDQMLVNPDFFVVTDTKSLTIDAGDVTREFEIIRDAALARDPAILDRIVPQVYDPDTYELTMAAYPWRSIIYTTYENTLPAEDILRFAAEKDNIHVITASYKDERFAGAQIEAAHNAGLLFYTHTLNSYEDIAKERSRGVDGLYTDLIIDAQMALYDALSLKPDSSSTAEEDASQAAPASQATSAPQATLAPEATPAPEAMLAPEATDEADKWYFLPPQEVAPTFEGFLRYASGLNDCAILLAVRGEAMQGLTEGALNTLKNLGVKSDLSVADGCSFVAMIGPDKVKEKAGYRVVERSGKLKDEAQYALMSAGDTSGDACSIKIDGKEYAPNAQGFNIVVYSTALHQVVHSGVYDTHTAD